jgi:hypothetical protein
LLPRELKNAKHSGNQAFLARKSLLSADGSSEYRIKRAQVHLIQATVRENDFYNKVSAGTIST